MPTESHTVEQAITRAIGKAAGNTPDDDWATLLRLSESTAREVRTLITGQLTKLLDMTATATEWNDAIEAAIQMVEDLS